MDDIDQIEVIRGPGGSLWGTNAVNGTVNIITRSSQGTQGLLLTEKSSSDTPISLTARYGGRVGKIGTYRIFSKYADAFGNQDATGQWAGDAWHLLHGGFRSDLKLREHDALMLEGDIYYGSFGEPLTEPLLVDPFAATVGGINSVSGGAVLGRWTHSYVNGQETQAQTYYANEDRDATERPDNLEYVGRGRTAPLPHWFEAGPCGWGRIPLFAILRSIHTLFDDHAGTPALPAVQCVHPGRDCADSEEAFTHRRWQDRAQPLHGF